ncbi:MAG TPA: glycosyltransferase family 2 protein [Bryobacteraceae bacterium]|jgi:GT2 family glycosyltransferase|nr:glycosyltransferase family 2 protein [Bryobacteraceae bacterium]
MGFDLSIIVPTHDRPRHLARTLQALMEQIERDFEVVVVADDCSDETFKVLERMGQAAQVPVRVVRCVEHSAARARNLGLAATSGRNCLFLDTDILVPRDFTRTLSTAFEKNPSTVHLTPLYGNAASSSTWPFLVNDSGAAEILECEELLEWASHQTRLRDVRASFADSKTGSLDHLPAPWVFCWSSALAVSRAIVERAGGFAEMFEIKGSEDIELGIRLSKAGVRFALLLNSCAFHLPHDRHRTHEESSDFVHALRLLATHTTPEVEAFCAFDCVNANPMIEILNPLTAKLGELAQHAASRSARCEVLCLPNHELIIGPPPSWSTPSANHARVVYPVPIACTDQLHLFGFALPFEDKSLRVAVITCLWQILPERLTCRLFDEAIRVAERVYVLKDSVLPIREIDIHVARLAAYDTPYWERTHRLRRSFYDYSLAPLAQDRELSSYELSQY